MSVHRRRESPRRRARSRRRSIAGTAGASRQANDPLGQSPSGYRTGRRVTEEIAGRQAGGATAGAGAGTSRSPGDPVGLRLPRVMLRRSLLSPSFRLGLTALVTLAMLTVDTNAQAWSNGTNGPNTFGTHDWIVREGVRLAGRHGRWVCLRTALRATDDPDVVSGIDHASGTWWHVWDQWGSAYGGAPEAIAVWHRRADRALARRRRCPREPCAGSNGPHAGRRRPADAHRSDSCRGVHPFELRERRGLQVHRQRLSVPRSQRRARRRRAVRQDHPPREKAHDAHSALVRSYRRGGYTSRVDTITRRQLNRAANVMADLIRSM